MFEDVITHRDSKGVKTVSRVSTDARVHSFTHHPTSIKPVVMLACSCGFEGLLPVPQDFGGENSKPVVCPNCDSPTVHPDNVTELPTTIVKFKDGSENKMVGSVSDELVPTNKVETSITAAEVQAMIDDKFGAIMQAISNLKPQTVAPATPVATPETSKTGGN